MIHSSTNMNYDPADTGRPLSLSEQHRMYATTADRPAQIHPDYNRWIQNLVQQVRAEAQ